MEGDTEQDSTDTTQKIIDGETANVCPTCKLSLRDRSPKLLPCLHSLCGACVVSFVACGEGKVKCSKCQHECLVTSVIDDLFLATSVENKSPDDDEHTLCTACEDNEEIVTSYCAECNEWLCDQCVQAHKRVRITKDHKVCPKDDAVVCQKPSEPESAVMYCTIHKQEPIKLFCENCDKLTCRDCQLQEHKEHKYQYVDEAAGLFRNQLQNLLKKLEEKRGAIENAKALCEKRKDEIKLREQEVASEIKDAINKINAEILSRGKTILTDLAKICHTKKQQLSNKDNEILGYSSKIDHCLKFVENAFQNGSNLSLLYTKSLIVNHLRNQVQFRCEVPNPHHIVDIRFSHNANFFSQHLQHVGVLMVEGIPFSPLNNNTSMPGTQINTSTSVSSQVNGQLNHSNSSSNGTTYPSSQFNNLPPQQKIQVIQKMAQMRNRHQMTKMMQQNQQKLSHQPPYAGYGPPNVTVLSGNHNAGHSLMHNDSSTDSTHKLASILNNGSPHPPGAMKSNTVYYPPTGVASVNRAMINLTQLQQQHLQNQSKQQQAIVHAKRRLQEQQIQQQQTMLLASQKHPPAYSRAELPQYQQAPRYANSSNSPSGIMTSLIDLTDHQMPQSLTGLSPPNLMPAQRLSISPTSNSGIHGMNRNTIGHNSSANHETEILRLLDGNLAGEIRSEPKVMRTSTSIANPLPVVKDEGKSSCALSFKPPPLSLTTIMSGNLKPKVEPGTVPNSACSTNSEPFDTSKIETQQTNMQNALDDIPMTLSDGLESLIDQQLSATNHLTYLASNKSSTTENHHVPTEGKKIPETKSDDDPSEDYCACCHNGGDLLCCDNCPKVFHLQCHIPTMPVLPTGNWTCALCEHVEDLRLQEDEIRSLYVPGTLKRKAPTGLSDKELTVCERILLELFCHEASPPFQEPVSKLVPNYYKIISMPMDFITIKCKLSRQHFNHYNSIDLLVSDIKLVFSNCAIFNAEFSEVGKAGKLLSGIFEDLLQTFLPTYVHIQRDTTTPESDISDSSDKSRPNKRKKRPEDIMHIC